MKRLMMGFMICALLSAPALSDNGKLRLYHVVQNGDTLSGVAHRYGTSMNTLAKVNNLKDHKIQIGSLLEVPWPTDKLRKATKINVVRHQVLPGDNIGAIAERYDSDVKSIMLLNKMPDTRIKIGKTLDVPTAGPMVVRENFIHEVRGGETLHVLAVKYRLLHRVIRYLNPGMNLKNLRAGQKVRLVRYVREKLVPKPAVNTPVKEKEAAVKPKAAVVKTPAVKPAPAKAPALPVAVKAKASVMDAPKTLNAPIPERTNAKKLPLTPAPAPAKKATSR